MANPIPGGLISGIKWSDALSSGAVLSGFNAIVGGLGNQPMQNASAAAVPSARAVAVQQPERQPQQQQPQPQPQHDEQDVEQPDPPIPLDTLQKLQA